RDSDGVADGAAIDLAEPDLAGSARGGSDNHPGVQHLRIGGGQAPMAGRDKRGAGDLGELVGQLDTDRLGGGPRGVRFDSAGAGGTTGALVAAGNWLASSTPTDWDGAGEA